MHSVSFVIPVHEETVYLSQCIHSILAQEELEECQIVIVLNAYEASFDWLYQTDADIVIAREDRKGASYARNCGIQFCKYDHIAFLDCDVELGSNWLKACMQLLTVSNQVACVQAKIIPSFREKSFLELYRSKTVRSITKGTFNYLYNPKVMPSLNSAAILCRKSALEDVGGFSTDFKRLEDTDFTYKLLAADYMIAVSLKGRCKVFNNHRSIYKYLKRSFVLGQYTNKLRRKWRLPNDRLGALEFNTTNFRVKIFHRLNYFVHRFGSAYEHLKSIQEQGQDRRSFVRLNNVDKLSNTYRLNGNVYKLRETVRVIIFSNKVHFMDFATDKVMVFKNFPKVISHLFKGGRLDGIPLNMLDSLFIAKEDEKNKND